MLLYEFKSDLNKYLAWLGPASPVHSLNDVIAFNNAHRDEELRYFGQELFTLARGKGAADGRGLQTGARGCLGLRRHVWHRRRHGEIPA